jgi:GT2 family glycosyltransferase/spore maturation protein CgeB
VRNPSLKDVHQCYLFFIGREAEPEAPIIEKSNLSIPVMIAGFVDSDEFQTSVVSAIIEAGDFVSPLFKVSPPAELLRWAANFIPLSEKGAETLLAARTWFAAINAVFLDTVFNIEVLTYCNITLPEEFLEQLIEQAASPLANVEDILVSDNSITLVVTIAKGAPADYAPVFDANRASIDGQETNKDLTVNQTAELGQERVEIRYVGNHDRVTVNVYMDGELLITQVPLSGGMSHLASNAPVIGRVDLCGPLFISGWMSPLPGPHGNEYEVLIDGTLSGKGRIPKTVEGEVPRFLFAIPKRFKDGRTHKVCVRRRRDGKILPATEGSFVIGVRALEAEWRHDGLSIRVKGDQAANLQPAQAKILLTADMEVVGSYQLGLTVGSSRRLVSGVVVPAIALIPFIGMRLTATLPALLAEVSVPVEIEHVTGPLVGSIDGIDSNSGCVFGWCAFRGRIDYATGLEASIDGEVFGTYPADMARVDLVGLHGKGFHGFRVKIPDKYRDGRAHTITLREQLTGAPVPKSPFPFTLQDTRIVRPRIVSSVSDTLSVVRSVNSPPSDAPVRKRVAVVILTRNGAQVLDECLASIWKYTPVGLIDIVIVDHQSTDETDEIVKRWQTKLPIDYHYIKGNNSFSFANNWAIRNFTSNEYVMLLNNDILFIEDVISRMIRYLDENDDVGLVGCKLLEARDRRDLTKASIHHLGIQLDLSPSGFIEAFETDRSAYIADQFSELITYGVTGACVLMRRNDYLAVGGLEESYFYGGEDVELGEAVWADLDKKVVCLNNVAALHHRGWLRLTVRGAEGLSRVQQNSRVLRERLGYQMRKRHAIGLIDPDRRWAASRARIGFVVVESGPVARTGEYFTAAELGHALVTRCGVDVEYVQPDSDWHDARGLTHLVNMLHEYRISDIQSDHPDLYKIAWMRNNFEGWLNTRELEQYHMIWCSSRSFCDELAKTHGINALYVPIATNLNLMKSGRLVTQYVTDVMFNGSNSGVTRSFIRAFEDPVWHDKLAIFGHGWESVPTARPMWRGFVPYSEMKNLYASTRIVIDQAHESASRWGGTNSRVFDAIAAGCLPLTNSAASSIADFDGLLPVWNTETDLANLVRFFLQQENERRALVTRLAKIVERHHQYEARAETIAGALLKSSQSVRSVAIKIGAPRRAEAHRWGDSHLAEALAVALRRRGLYVQVQCIEDWNRPTELFDAALVMRGLSRYVARGDELTLAWVISHPDNLSTEEVSLYDGIAFASQTLADRHHGTGVPATVARQFSAFGAPHATGPEIDAASAAILDNIFENDIVFVGNTRGKVRNFIIDIARLLPIKIIGDGWDQYVPMDMVLGNFISNAALPHVYSKAFAVLNDHWPDMLDANIVSNRVIDVVMSGGLVISDWNREGASLVLEDMFFRSADEAVAGLRRFRADPAARARAIADARGNVSRYFSAEVTANRVFELLNTAHANRMAGSKRGRLTQISAPHLGH